MREVRSQMRALLDEMAFEGDPQAYLEELTANPKWRAETPEGIADVFQRYIDRMAPKVEEVFRFKPKAAYGVRPLAPELTGSMTFGYYSMPSPHQPDGRSEEHTSELQSLMRNSYAVFCLKKKKYT